jgi:hypothetical protein
MRRFRLQDPDRDERDEWLEDGWEDEGMKPDAPWNIQGD